MGVLRKYGSGLVLAGRTLRVVLFGKQLKSSTTAPIDGQVLRYVAADDAWSPGTVSGGGSLPSGTAGGVMVYTTVWGSTAAGTARQVFTSGGGAVAPGWGQDVLPLRIGATVAAALPSDAALGLQWDVRSIVVRGSGNAAWMDVWRVNGSSGEWVYGTSDATDCAGAVLLAPSSGAGLYLRRGATNHVSVNSAGVLTLGNASFQTTITGSRIVLQTPIAVHDANTSSVVTAATIAHTLSSGTAAAGIGARATLAAHNASGTLTDACAIDGVLTNVGAGTEAGALAVSTRTGGGALTERIRVHGAGGVTIGTTTALTSGLGLASGLGLWGRNAAGSAWVNAIGITGGEVQIGDASNIGVLVTTGPSALLRVQTAGVVGFAYRGYLTAASGVQQQLKLSEPIEQSGTAGWTLLELSPTLTTQGSGAKRAISYIVSGSERFGINELGRVINGNATNEATSATAGTNGAPPAQVAGYLLFQDSAGNTRKIPYYAN